MNEAIIVITGGAGFLGRHMAVLLTRIEEMTILKGLNITEIRIFDIRKPDFKPFSESQPFTRDFSFHGNTMNIKTKKNNEILVRFIEGSILDVKSVENAFEGANVVFHCASLVDFGQHSKEKIHSINVTGTENVISAAKSTNIRYLVYTSTTEVASWKTRPNIEMKETDSQPNKFHEYLGGNYGYSKRLAEDLILEANSESLKTCSVRPKGLYGEVDPYVLVNMLQALKEGQLSCLLGSPETKLEAIYVGNVAYAHLFLLSSLIENKDKVAGEAFFVSCEKKKNLAEFLSPFADMVDTQLPTIYIPAAPLIFIASWFDKIKVFLPKNMRSNKFSEQSIRSVAWTQTVCGDKLKALGFKPYFSKEQSVDLTRSWLKHHWLPTQDKPPKPLLNMATTSLTIGAVVLIGYLFFNQP